MRRFPAIIVVLLGLAACSDLPPIDSSISFNIVRNADFVTASGISLGIDTSIVAHIKIDTNKDYATNKTAAYLLSSSRIMISGLNGNERGRDRRHSGREAKAKFAILQRCKIRLERFTRRVDRAAVIVLHMLAERVLRVGCRLIDRYGDGARKLFGFLSGMNGLGRESWHLSEP